MTLEEFEDYNKKLQKEFNEINSKLSIQRVIHNKE